MREILYFIKFNDEFGRPRSEIYDENIADSWSAVSVWPAKTKSLPKTFVADQRAQCNSAHNKVALQHTTFYNFFVFCASKAFMEIKNITHKITL
jgi:hypothetical protein